MKDYREARRAHKSKLIILKILKEVDMPALKCIVCGGAVVQDMIQKDRHVGVYDGCHCTGCGIKFKPNLDELGKLFENLLNLRIRP